MASDVKLDVRPLLASGQEPFATIMQAVDQLGPGQSLTLIAPFKPVPLLSVMSRKGFSSRSERVPDGSWQVIFTPEPSRNLCVSPLADDVAIWPDPARLVDLSQHDSATAIAAIEDIVESLGCGEVGYMLLADPPGDWLDGFTRAGHQWAWSYDDKVEGFGLMIRAAVKNRDTG